MDTHSTTIPQLDHPYAEDIYKEFSRNGHRRAAFIRPVIAFFAIIWVFFFSGQIFPLFPLLVIIIYAALTFPTYLFTKESTYRQWPFFVLVITDMLLLSILLFLLAENINPEAFGIFLYMPLVALSLLGFNSALLGTAIVSGLTGYALQAVAAGTIELNTLLAGSVLFALTGGFAVMAVSYKHSLICSQLIEEREYYSLLLAELEKNVSAEEEEEQVEYIDRLTNLGTHAAFERDSSIFTSIYAEGRLNDLTIAFIDIENPNDLMKKYGPKKYKQMLRLFAHLARKKFRSSDMVYRFSSDQFVLLAPGASLTNADRLQDLLRQISEQVTANGFPTFKATMGISTLGEAQTRE
jgi:diguanylate cyclase (GGDEF)-like protein